MSLPNLREVRHISKLQVLDLNSNWRIWVIDNEVTGSVMDKKKKFD